MTLGVPSSRWPRIAVLGAGHTGPVIARVAVEAGYQVSIAASGDPERIELIAQVLAPGAEPRWAADAAREADIVMLAIPLHKLAALQASLVAGKLVVDTMNYWPPIDGVQQMFEDRRYGSSEIVQHRLASSTIVKTLNHIGYHQLDDKRRPAGSPDRRALGVASDDPVRGRRCGGPHRANRLRRCPAQRPERRPSPRTWRPRLRCIAAPRRVRPSRAR